jgi:O-antigen ligase
LLTIFNPESDKTGSAQERQKLLQHGVVLAAAHPVVGIGMGNFHIFSIRELRAHNSYVEIAAELGVAGLVAYVLLIVVPLHSLRRIERETFNTNSPTTNYIYCMALALQASLASYLITSTFGSYQYSWFVYYVVSYAIALRTIHNPKQMESVEPVCMSRSAGTIWSQSREGSTVAPLKTVSCTRNPGGGRRGIGANEGKLQWGN